MTAKHNGTISHSLPGKNLPWPLKYRKYGAKETLTPDSADTTTNAGERTNFTQLESISTVTVIEALLGAARVYIYGQEKRSTSCTLSTVNWSGLTKMFSGFAGASPASPSWDFRSARRSWSDL